MKHATDAALEEATSLYSLSTKVLSIAPAIDQQGNAINAIVGSDKATYGGGSHPLKWSKTAPTPPLPRSFAPKPMQLLREAATPRGRVNSCRRCRALSQYPSAAKRSWQRFRLCIILGPDYIGAVFSPVLLNC